MTTVKRFEDLECWKEARVLVKKVYVPIKQIELIKPN